MFRIYNEDCLTGMKKIPGGTIDACRRTILNDGRVHRTGAFMRTKRGGGSTSVAAVRCGRRFIGFETEKKFFEICQKRLQAEMSAREGRLV